MNWESGYIRGLITAALAEDIGTGDSFVAATISAGVHGEARIEAKQELICAGLPLAEKVFQALDPEMRVEMRRTDGCNVEKGQTVLQLYGVAAAILTGEPTVLNFLGRMSGIATLTHKFVEKIAGTGVKIRDTQKTTPGLRLLERYAVRVGGGMNCQFGLFDAILLKEHHIVLAGGVKAALDQAHSFVSSQMKPRSMTAYEAVGTKPSEAEVSSLPIQIEIRTEGELQEALFAGAEAVLLKNMCPAEARQCVGIVRNVRPECIVEISEGITLANVRAYAETGADYLSCAALTQAAPNAEFALLVDIVQ
ncbi:MAG: nicotinate-nucleotide diphosphorylase [Candidatus Acidiferrum sp.]